MPRSFAILLTSLMLLITACSSDSKNPPAEPAAETVTTEAVKPAAEPAPVIEQEPASGMTLYKTAQCGCCGLWVDHMQAAGFSMAVVNSPDMNAVKQQLGIQPVYQSCHTLVDKNSGYIFEGHIPAEVVARFLQEKPEGALGLSVPGMPIGSPGMEMGGRYDDYDVLQLNKDGSSVVYEEIRFAVNSNQ